MSLTKGLDINTNQSIMLFLLESGLERMHPFGDQSLTFPHHVPKDSFSALWGNHICNRFIIDTIMNLSFDSSGENINTVFLHSTAETKR